MRFLKLIGLPAALLALPGCGSSDDGGGTTGACEPNAVLACACPGGAMGVQTCGVDGASVSACSCDGTAPPPPPPVGPTTDPPPPGPTNPVAPPPTDPVAPPPPVAPGGTLPSGFPSVADFETLAGGPFQTSRTPEGPACEVFRPVNLGEGGLVHPVIVWGNGTFTSPDAYWQILDHWATHGFFVIAASTSNAGTGAEMLACLDYALGTYAGQVDPAKIGASGHSQGGGGSIMVGADPRVTVTVPLQPFVVGLGHNSVSQSQQNGPMLLLSGDQDTWAPPGTNQQPVFNASTVPTFWATKIGADHLVSATNDIDDYRRPATAWFRLHLMGDESAREMFYGACTLCQDPGWIVQTKNL